MTTPQFQSVIGAQSWRVRAINNKKTKLVTITKVNLLHTCEAADHWSRRMHSNADYLAKSIFDIVMRNRTTWLASIRDTAQALIHPDIRYHTAYVAKKKAMEKLDGREIDSFFLIPAHCRHILDWDPRATAKYAAPDGKFELLFVCPSSARQAYKHCRPLVAFDGTFTHCSYPQMLLIATAMDANNTILMLAYCMVPTENPTKWLRFLKLIRVAISELEKPLTVFIFDRGKGLLDGVDEIFPSSFHSFCTWHLGDNCRQHYNKATQKEFEPLVYACTAEQIQRRLERIRQKNKGLADYIVRTKDAKHYSRAFCPVVSQQAESLNRALKPQRQEVAFKQSHLLWDYMMTKLYEKAQLAASITTPFPPNIMNKLKHIEEKAIQLVVDVLFDCECRITDFLGRQFLVKFEPEWFCSCGDWQDIRLTCVHACRACTRLQKCHFDYVDPYYSTVAYQHTYSGSIPAIIQENLVLDPKRGPPIICRKRGGPSKKAKLKLEEEAVARRARKCGHCKQTGHDRRKCKLRDTILSQARGRGPTLESDEEDLVESSNLLLGKEPVGQSDSPTGENFSFSSFESEPDEDFGLDAMAARKEENQSDYDTQINSHPTSQVVIDMSTSQCIPPADMS